MLAARRNLKWACWQMMTGFWGMLAFSVILSVLIVSILVITGAEIAQFKVSIQGAMLLTVVLLLHRSTRHFLLIPAGIAFVCSLFGSFGYLGYF
ncbi:DUF1435 family protein [Xenorhabdus sp. IM139775]|uniref:DUF1435 family protein n=1 Tax=Xenorhabdus sp. IM139775 TaxID=3025876 RepID=UPI00235A23BB|nr:DUF1435 family protein [Xenorhabdus sp. IM139775]MDC9593063.1 DUF1435 family protein [Xenorhabdus sp. IM139775]